jgi:hypothetical protein
VTAVEFTVVRATVNTELPIEASDSSVVAPGFVLPTRQCAACDAAVPCDRTRGVGIDPLSSCTYTAARCQSSKVSPVVSSNRCRSQLLLHSSLDDCIRSCRDTNCTRTRSYDAMESTPSGDAPHQVTTPLDTTPQHDDATRARPHQRD